MNRTLSYALTLLLSLFAFTSQAQMFDPVSWSTEAHVDTNGNVTLYATASIDDGWHLYSQSVGEDGPIPTSFYLKKDTMSYDGTRVSFEEEGAHVVYSKVFEMDLASFEGYGEFVFGFNSDSLKVGDIQFGEVEFMVCNDEMCLPPTYKQLTWTMKEAPAVDESTQNGGLNAGLIALLFQGLGFGFLALLMPCIFPMIPLTVSFFLKQAKTKAQGIQKGLIFGLSIIGIYVALGVLITVVFGPDAMNAMATDPWFNIFFFVLFVVFALSFLGAFEITLPSSWVEKSEKMSARGGLIGIFFMAFTLALVSFSCTGPLIGTALVTAAQTGEYMGPVMVMLGFSAGLAIPFMFFAAFPGYLNSMQSGGWLNTVKVVLGFVELAFALKFLSTADMVWQAHMIERELFIAVWVACAFITAYYLFGGFRMPNDSPVETISTTRASFGVLFTVAGFYLLPGIFGAPVKIISGFPPPSFYSEGGIIQSAAPPAGAHNSSSGHAEGTCPLNLPCFHDLDEAMAYAQEVDKPVMLDFTGWGCVNCRKMEEQVWSDPTVWNMLANDVVLVSLYVDERSKLEEEKISPVTGKPYRHIGQYWSEFQAEQYGANAQPYYIMLDAHKGYDPLHEYAAFDPDIPKFIDWMERGIEAYKISRQ